MPNGNWYINLSGVTITVYDSEGKNEVGKITNNECFISGNPSASTGWDGWGQPVVFLDAAHNLVCGGVAGLPNNIGKFTEYASNGSSWTATSSLVRKVQYATNIYSNKGAYICSVPAGSYVSLDSDNVCGQTNNNYISIKSYTINGNTTTASPNAFIDLIPNSNSWISVKNILLRKA